MSKPFLNEEMKKLWDNKKNVDVAIILLLCYTGWRVDELIKIKREDTDPDDLFMRGGVFTNRTVPIHWAIHNEIFLRLFWYGVVKQSEYYLCNYKTAEPLTVSEIERRFRNKMAVYRMNHKISDTRCQFVYMCKEASLDNNMINYLIGQGYGEYDLKELKYEIDKLKYQGGIMPVYMW